MVGEGVPHPRSEVGGTPSQVWGGTLARFGWWGVPHPRSGVGVPHLRSGRGVPWPGLDGGGVPHPRSGVGGVPQTGLDHGRVPRVPPQHPQPGLDIVGYPIQGLGWGVPQPGLDGGGYPIPGLGLGDIPQPGVDGGGYPGYPPARSGWLGGDLGYPFPTRQSSIASTCYAAGNMPPGLCRRTFLFFNCSSICSCNFLFVLLHGMTLKLSLIYYIRHSNFQP